MPSDIDRVKKLLPHWMEHNAEHAEEYREWAEKIRALDAGSAADDVARAAAAMMQANEHLQAAMGRLSQE